MRAGCEQTGRAGSAADADPGPGDTNRRGDPVATKVEQSDRAVVEPVMVDVQWVAEALRCSARHVHRLRDAGLLPPPVRLGALIRWSRTVLEKWIHDGCPAVRRPAATR
jgi:predicted DNA-binding transcriptional regulator AlpA